MAAMAVGLLAAWGGPDRSEPGGLPRIVTTVNPIRAIVAELASGRAEVVALLPPNASPHTYEPRPSDAVEISRARAFVHVAPSLDAWAASLESPHSIELLPLLPEEYHRLFASGESCADHHHGAHDHEAHGENAVDPHFWTDPLTVKALLPNLADALAKADPGGAEIYRANAEAFALRLEALDARLSQELAPIHDRPIILFHPSFRYMIERYGLTYGGVVEEMPGREATPAYLHGLVKTVHDREVRALFTEPQLSPRPARVLAEAAGVPLFVLDPNGGVEGRMSYEELLLYNADVLRTSLR